MHMPPYPQPLPQGGGGLWCNLPVSWATLNQCGNNWLKEIRSRPVASGRVTFLNDCGPHRHLRTFFTKQKLFLLKSWF
jgi:hypothetical protein